MAPDDLEKYLQLFRHYGWAVLLGLLGLAAVVFLAAKFFGKVAEKQGEAFSDHLNRKRKAPSPPPSTAFFGRDEELTVIINELTAGTKVALCAALEGMGGVGKTRLAQEVGHRARDSFPDGVVLVDLRGSGDKLMSTEEAMAAVLTHPAGSFDKMECLPAGDALASLYRQQLNGRRMLLVLDNARDGEHAEPLLPPPGVACIITSRRTVALAGVSRHDVDTVDSEAARALLRSYTADRIADTLLDELGEACYRVPLALHTIGKFLKAHPTYPTTEYLDRLRRDRLGKLEAVREALLITWQQAKADNPGVAERWPLLAVFQGEFFPPLAAQVCGVADGLDFLTSLKSLGMVLAPEVEGGWWRLHDLMREVAYSVAGNLGEARKRHAQVFEGALAAANDLYRGGKVLEGLALFDRVRTDVETAFAWCRDHLDADDEAARLCFAFTNTGVDVLDLRLSAGMWLTWLQAAVTAARRLGELRPATVALGNLGIAHAKLGELRRAIELFEERLAIARQIQDRGGEGMTLGNLGNVYLALGEPQRAVEYYEQDLDIAREITDRRGEGDTLGNLGIAYRHLGEPQRAIKYHDQHLAIAREVRDQRGEGTAYWNMALARHQLGERGEAVRLARAAFLILDALEDPNAAEVRAVLVEWEAEGEERDSG